MGEVASMEKQLGGDGLSQMHVSGRDGEQCWVMVGGSSSSSRKGYVWLDERDMLWKG